MSFSLWPGIDDMQFGAGESNVFDGGQHGTAINLGSRNGKLRLCGERIHGVDVFLVAGAFGTGRGLLRPSVDTVVAGRAEAGEDLRQAGHIGREGVQPEVPVNALGAGNMGNEDGIPE